MLQGYQWAHFHITVCDGSHFQISGYFRHTLCKYLLFLVHISMQIHTLRALQSELVLIPQEKLNAIRMVLESDEQLVPANPGIKAFFTEESTPDEDPWEGLLEDDL